MGERKIRMEQRWGWEGRTITKNKGESKKKYYKLPLVPGAHWTCNYIQILYSFGSSKVLHWWSKPDTKKKKAFLEEQDCGKGAEGFTKENKGGPLTDSEKAMTPHSCTLAWKIPWAEEPGRLQSMGSWRVRHDWTTSLSLFTFMHRRRKWQPTPVFLPGESQGWGSLVGCCLWGRTVSDTTEAT